MVIAVDISISEKSASAWRRGMVYKNLNTIAGMYPRHTFIFIFDRSFSGKQVFAENTIPVVAGPRVNNQLMRHFWYNYKLPALLRKYKADIFLGVHGCCSMNTQVPQHLFFGDDFCTAGHLLQDKKATHFAKKQLPLFLEKATRVITTTNFCREQILDILPAAAPKTVVACAVAGAEFIPMAWDEAALVKAQYAGGKEYFLHGGGIRSKSQFVNLLKAFSLFKKRQKSNMHMILAGDITLPKDDLKTTIGTYKYRDDVRLTGYLSTPVFARLLAGAYALVHTGAGRQLVVEAMCCGVPLIVADTDVLRYICGNAALYTNPDNVEDVAEQLMLIYKDENLRHRQIALGNIQVDPHRPPAAVDKLAEALLGTHALATATVV